MMKTGYLILLVLITGPFIFYRANLTRLLNKSLVSFRWLPAIERVGSWLVFPPYPPAVSFGWKAQ
jgi:hypothetical protein